MGDVSIRVVIGMPMAGRAGIVVTAVTVAIVAASAVAVSAVNGLRVVTIASAAKAVAVAIGIVVAASAGVIKIGASVRQSAGMRVDRKVRVIAVKDVEAKAGVEMAAGATEIATAAATT